MLDLFVIAAIIVLMKQKYRLKTYRDQKPLKYVNVW